MWLGVLGPLLVENDAAPIAVPQGKQRTILAALLCQANRVVSYDALAEAIWQLDPPPSARVTTRNYIKRLREGLGPVVGGRIVTRISGYLIEVGDDEFDLLAFDRQFSLGEDAARSGEWHKAADALDAALSLWRGEPFSDIPSESLRDSQLPHLTELRLRALEARFEAGLRRGEDGELVAELRRLVDENPVYERFYAQLMLALYRAGRQGEALAVYQTARRVLVGELGIEPGGDLRRLHERILAGDASLDSPSLSGYGDLSDAAPPREDAPVPRQLPVAVGHFAGRADELKALSTVLDQCGRAGGSVVISAISGTAGIGKTALAVHWAHAHADRFPDGQLYVNLRGFDPLDSPLSVCGVVRRFLDALGVPSARIPADLDAQLDLYRTLLADKRMLVVLDNARTAEQVRPLLPGAGGCLVLVTSRNRLAGLVAVDGAVPLALDLLPLQDARILLADRLGAERVAAWADTADELIGLCARLPLALNIAAALTALRPHHPLDLLVAELRDAGRRLTALDTGDPAADVRAVFWWSYRTLESAAARMFRLLGTHPGPDISVAAAAGLAGTDRVEALRLLDTLTAAHLLTEHAPGRFSFHDLLRVYAAEQAEMQDSDAERNDALRRMLDHYLHSAHAARRSLYPGWRSIDLAAPADGVTPERFATRDEVLAWYKTEFAVLRAVVTRAAETQFDTHTWQLCWALTSFLQLGVYSEDWITISETALAAAQRSGDPAGQAYAHRWLGDALLASGDTDHAHKHFQHALALHRELGDRTREGNTHFAIARALEQDQRLEEARDHAQQAYELYHETDYLVGRAQALNAIGWYEIQLGRYHEALRSCGKALELSRETGDPYAEAATLDSLGCAHDKLGEHPQAVEYFERALELQQSASGYFYLQTLTLTHLGDAHLAAGDTTAAREAWRKAIVLLDELQHPDADVLRARIRDLNPVEVKVDG